MTLTFQKLINVSIVANPDGSNPTAQATYQVMDSSGSARVGFVSLPIQPNDSTSLALLITQATTAAKTQEGIS